MHNRDDYGDLLLTFRDVHVRLEAAVFAPEWDQVWRELGIVVGSHRQLDLLAADLASLGRTADHDSRTAVLSTDPTATDPTATDPAGAAPALSGGAEALGCLYVLEGSAIGRRVLSPLLQAELGDVPTAFFDGVGRHPQAWRDVQRSIASLAARPEQQPRMLSGARTAFQVFLHHLRRRSDRRVLSSA